MEERTAARHLAGAELWMRPPQDAETALGAPAAFIAGWEDADPFCAAVCSTDVGLAFCRRCPEPVVARAFESGRAAHGTCGAGVRMLAFPAPHGAPTTVAVLRVGPPDPRRAATVSAATRVDPQALRRAARQAPKPDARSALRAARRLRDPDGLVEWAEQQRALGSDRRRTATAALAQMIATSEEFHDLYRASENQRREIERNRRRLDRLARETLRASEDERARIAHEIHDTAAQSMVSAFRFLDAARTIADAVSDPAVARPGVAGPGALTVRGVGESRNGETGREAAARASRYLSSASELLLDAIREIRGVLDRLVPPGLEELGLADAIERRARALGAEAGLSVEVTGELPRLDPSAEQTLYGMATEAVANAVRHARASHLDVTLREVRGRGVILVRDDGQGLDPARVAPGGAGRGLGLLGIARQASWLGGRATVRSAPGTGTTVRISVPLGRHLRPVEPTAGDAASGGSEPSGRRRTSARVRARVAREGFR